VHLRTCFSAELFGLKQDRAEYGGSIFGLLPLDEDRVRQEPFAGAKELA
jgi:hypothetical protein